MFSSRSGLKPSLFTPISSSINSATLGFKKAKGCRLIFHRGKRCSPFPVLTLLWGKTVRARDASRVIQKACKSLLVTVVTFGDICLSPWWHLVCWKSDSCSFWKRFPWHAASQRGKGPDVQTDWEMLCASGVSTGRRSPFHTARHWAFPRIPSQDITWSEHCGARGGRAGTPVQVSVPCHPDVVSKVLGLLTCTV